MLKPTRDAVLKHVRRMAAARSYPEATDGQLHQRFLGQHGEGAFTTLVRRHGAMMGTYRTHSHCSRRSRRAHRNYA